MCYSNFLSHRDYSLFKNLFIAFGTAKRVVYSKITKFSDDAVPTKGDICQLIVDLIERKSLDTGSGRPSDPQKVGEEILMVDEALSPHTADGRVQSALGEVLGLGDLRQNVAVMCRDLRHFEEPPYVYDPITDRVGYVTMDSVCYDVTYGYRTAFAYLLHSTAPTEDFRREALRPRVPCGKFSYTHLRPARIFGVSGTLSALSNYE